MKRVLILMLAFLMTFAVAVPTQADPSRSSVPASGKPKPHKPHKPQPPKWRPAEGGFFNTPRHGAKQWVLHQHIVAAIEHARPHSFIRIALFSFDRKFVASKLVKAHARGVHVQVLL